MEKLGFSVDNVVTRATSLVDSARKSETALAGK